MRFSRGQRAVLWVAAAIGLFGINGLFLYAAFLRPGSMGAAYGNPFALAFILEAFVLLPLFCFVIHATRLRAPGWFAFLVMSLAGSLAFSVPLSLLLWTRRTSRPRTDSVRRPREA